MLEAVQNARLFSDSKHFVDMNLMTDPGERHNPILNSLLAKFVPSFKII